ncbi:hypothetical protein PsYK624_010120 [Phanerochaete sordida]|uniref:UBA domain-containing protein n=1 Tax=Phanerochaete sordida TaxID=48140 RepID=A0A9P3FYH8_9APHY|nr:hypothetical protein PsYK624_010120 [Phanerochaete sordida]
MSRHRDVRNMNIEDELDDDAISDGGEADLPPEEYEQLMNGLDEIRATLGSAEASGFTDDFIKETLYHYYYDVDQAVDYLLEEQGRRQAVQERKGQAAARRTWANRAGGNNTGWSCCSPCHKSANRSASYLSPDRGRRGRVLLR